MRGTERGEIRGERKERGGVRKRGRLYKPSTRTQSSLTHPVVRAEVDIGELRGKQYMFNSRENLRDRLRAGGILNVVYLSKNMKKQKVKRSFS